MPMIEFRYNSEKIPHQQATAVGADLEGTLRFALKELRPGLAHDYGVTIEGDPFRIHHNQPDLRIYVFYHEEWNFSPSELAVLPRMMAKRITAVLQRAKVAGVNVKIRFYARTGHASASIEV